MLLRRDQPRLRLFDRILLQHPEPALCGGRSQLVDRRPVGDEPTFSYGDRRQLEDADAAAHAGAVAVPPFPRSTARSAWLGPPPGTAATRTPFLANGKLSQ
jgi:hypothetical protein